jgi:hypothetical protein
MSQTLRGFKEQFFNSTSGIFTAGVVDTIGKFATGCRCVVDTGGAHCKFGSNQYQI